MHFIAGLIGIATAAGWGGFIGTHWEEARTFGGVLGGPAVMLFCGLVAIGLATGAAMVEIQDWQEKRRWKKRMEEPIVIQGYHFQFAYERVREPKKLEIHACRYCARVDSKVQRTQTPTGVDLGYLHPWCASAIQHEAMKELIHRMS